MYDPTFLHARREALIILLLFGGFAIASLTASYTLGLDTSQAVATQVVVWGMPAWVFWGIFLPWVLVNGVVAWFCFVYMRDDDLGEASSSEQASSLGDRHHPSSDSTSELGDR